MDRKRPMKEGPASLYLAAIIFLTNEKDRIYLESFKIRLFPLYRLFDKLSTCKFGAKDFYGKKFN
jgi:hypothetical protein